MKIEIFSDFMCPYCYIGLKSLERAIEKSGVKPEIEFLAYELNPNIKSEHKKLKDTIKEKHNLNDYEVQGTMNRIVKYAKEEGLDYNMEDAIAANTHLAHLAMKYAKSVDKDHEFEEELMKAAFIKGEDVGDIEVINKIASEIGLNVDEMLEFIDMDSTKALVLDDNHKAEALGVKVIPTYRIDEDRIIEGTLDTAEWIEILNGAE